MKLWQKLLLTLGSLFVAAFLLFQFYSHKQSYRDSLESGSQQVRQQLDWLLKLQNQHLNALPAGTVVSPHKLDFSDQTDTQDQASRPQVGITYLSGKASGNLPPALLERAVRDFQQERRQTELQYVDKGFIYQFVPLQVGSACSRCHGQSSTLFDNRSGVLVGVAGIGLPFANDKKPLLFIRTDEALIGLVILAIIFITGAWLLNSLIIRPLASLKVATRQLAQGDFSIRIGATGDDELAEVAQAFDQMAMRAESDKQQLLASERRYRKFFEQAPQPYQALSDKGLITEINGAWKQLLGYRKSEVIGRSISEFLLQPQLAKQLTPAAGARENHEIECRDLEMRCKDGAILEVAAYGRIARDSGGRGAQYHYILQDITAQKKAERHLQMFRRQIDQSRDALFVIDCQTTGFIDVNQSTCHQLGYTRNELLSLCFADILPSGMHSMVWDDLSKEVKGAAGGITYETRLITSDGVVFPAEISAIFQPSAAQGVIVASARDITERKHAEMEMQKLSQAVEQSPAAVLITDADGIIQYVNQKFETTSGYSKTEVLGKSPRILKSDKMPDTLYRELWQAIRAGREWKGELQNRRKNGELYWEAVAISPIFDQEGNITHFLGLKEDISQAKHAEEVVRRTQKMEAIGQLTGGIAHDFNNLLGIISGNLYFLSRLTQGDEKLGKRVATALRATERATNLTRQLLGFSRKQSQNIVPLNLNTVIREMDSLLSRSLHPGIEMVFQLHPDLWMARADRGELEDALINLALNARDAMQSSGTFTIATENLSIKELDSGGDNTLPNGDYVRLSIQDSGAGIAEADLEHIFEPFFTTKPKDKGTGLGLSMVYGFTRRCGGDIQVISQVGQGTTFQILLPRANATPIATTAAEAPALPRATAEQIILVVDDEIDLLQLTGEYLVDLGYQVLPAHSGAEALKLLEREGAIDLLLSDIVMPGGIDGYQLAAQAQAIRPALRILLTSGYSDVPPEETPEHLCNLLHKPFDQATLAHRVNEVLSADGPAG